MSAQRNNAVDAIRFVAIFGVVLIHMSPSTPAGGTFTDVFHLFSVPFFLLISLYFFINRVGALPAPGLGDLRLDRLLVPYAVWSLIYTGLRLLKLRFLGRPPTFDVLDIVFFGGGAVQMSFLPMLVYYQVLVLAVILASRTSADRWIALGLGMAALGYACALVSGNHMSLPALAESTVLYTAMPFLLTRLQAGPVGRRINVVAGWLIVGFILASAYLGRPPIPLDPVEHLFISGYGVAALALNARFRPIAPAWGILLTCSYGIYLAHFAFLESFEVAAKKFGFALTPYSVTTKLVMGSLICGCCVLCILLARLHRLSAYLFFGEGKMPARIRSLPAVAIPSSSVASA